jgi:hypothetical protein
MMSTDPIATGQQGLDRALIVETAYKLATGLDTKNWDLLREITTSDLEIDMSSYTGSRELWSREDWLARCADLFPGLDATQHLISNAVVTFSDDEAICRSYVQAVHILRLDRGDPEWTLGGTYYMTFRRADDDWLIHRLSLDITWERGNRQIMAVATKPQL